ncbi:MAG: hypothetical protein K2L31_07095, partial [Muribaculum sp.]|nr:hypothetical protein [Muribaculum sp.]
LIHALVSCASIFVYETSSETQILGNQPPEQTLHTGAFHPRSQSLHGVVENYLLTDLDKIKN